MQRLFERIARQAESLRELSEELEQQLDLIYREAREEIEEVEWRVHHLENDLLRLREDLREPAAEVARSARSLACEVAASCKRLAHLDP